MRLECTSPASGLLEILQSEIIIYGNSIKLILFLVLWCAPGLLFFSQLNNIMKTIFLGKTTNFFQFNVSNGKGENDAHFVPKRLMRAISIKGRPSCPLLLR